MENGNNSKEVVEQLCAGVFIIGDCQWPGPAVLEDFCLPVIYAHVQASDKRWVSSRVVITSVFCLGCEPGVFTGLTASQTVSWTGSPTLPESLRATLSFADCELGRLSHSPGTV